MKPDNLGSATLVCYPNGHSVRNSYHWLYNSRDVFEDEWCYSEVVNVSKGERLIKLGSVTYFWTGKTRSIPCTVHRYGTCLHAHYSKRIVHSCTLEEHQKIANELTNLYNIKDALGV